MPKTHKKIKKRKTNRGKKRSTLNCYEHQTLLLGFRRCTCTQIESDSDSDMDDFLVSMFGDLDLQTWMELERTVLFCSLLREANMPYEYAIQKQKLDEIVKKMYAAWLNEDGTLKTCGRCDKCLASSSKQ